MTVYRVRTSHRIQMAVQCSYGDLQAQRPKVSRDSFPPSRFPSSEGWRLWPYDQRPGSDMQTSERHAALRSRKRMHTRGSRSPAQARLITACSCGRYLGKVEGNVDGTGIQYKELPGSTVAYRRGHTVQGIGPRQSG